LEEIHDGKGSEEENQEVEDMGSDPDAMECGDLFSSAGS
jgi:hypothetical protein